MRKISTFLALSALLLPVMLFGACAPEGQGGTETESGDPAFVYEGGGVFADGVNYHIVLTGNNDTDKTFVLKVKEMPMLELGGNYVYVENKGYKFYFNDTDKSFAYARYDAGTKEFTLKYNLNLGGGQGRSKVVLNCKDEAFAASYDGEGLPPLPPTFSGHGWNGTNRHDCVLYCYEDGTCVSITDKAGVPNRSGTYTYDAATNVYSFEFEDESSHYPANYLTQCPDGHTAYRLDYCVFRGDDPSTGNYRSTLCSVDEGGFPDFTKSAFWVDESGERHTFEFKTTYDEATKTYTLYYEAYSKGLQCRVVTYTVDD